MSESPHAHEVSDAPPPVSLSPGRDHSPLMRVITVALLVGAGLMLAPLWVALVLAAWVTNLARPLHRKIEKRLHGRAWAASVLVLGLVLGLVTPIILIIVSLVGESKQLVETLRGSTTAKEFLTGFVGQGAGGAEQSLSLKHLDPARLIQLAREHGPGGWNTLSAVSGALAEWTLALFVFLCAAYAFLVDGEAYYKWLADHSPMGRVRFHRLANAFNESGHGLVIGMGLTALAQGVLATIAYVVLGVPQWLILGLMTTFAALIPSFGTAIIWLPIAAGLFLTGRTTSAIILVVVGTVVIGSADNLLRPVLSRYGKLELPSILILVSVFGGLAVVGPSGLFLGPLLVRLGKEALLIAKDDGLF